MGQCGCGDFQPMFKFPAPDGAWYAFEVYPGCGYCDNGPGVTIHRMSAQESEEWDVPHLPDLPWHELGYPNAGDVAEFAIPIIETAALRAAIHNVVGDGDEYDVQGAIEDGTKPEVLREAVFTTLENWRALRAAQEER